MSAAKSKAIEKDKRGLSREEMERNLATREMLRKKAMERVLAAAGKCPDLATNEEVEGP